MTRFPLRGLLASVTLALCAGGLAGCGDQVPAGAGTDEASADGCPPYPVWDVGSASDTDDGVDVPSWVETGVGDTPEAAVADLAAGRDLRITVRETRAAEPSDRAEDPDVDLVVSVEDARGNLGTYDLDQHGDVWVVSSGRGCGAPEPQEMTVLPPDCPTTPTFPPGGTPSVYTVRC